MNESSFYEECRLFLERICSPTIQENEIYRTYIIHERTLAIVLIPLKSYALLNPNYLLHLVADLNKSLYQTIVIPEDIWLLNKDQIYRRLSVRFGIFERIHARKCQIVSVSQTELSTFMETNHLMGSAKSKFKYALSYENRFVAMASFSAIRKYYRGNKVYNSSELVRFANSENIVVAGGLSKLLTHFIRTKHPDDIMTYIDRQWSEGRNYGSLGFEAEGITAPIVFWFDPINNKRFPENRLPTNLKEEARRSGHSTEEYLRLKDLIKTFDLGNYKFLKKINP